MSVSEIPPVAPAVRKSGLVRNSLINAGFTLISRLAGFARDLVIANYLGASANIMADAYATAQQFPNLFRRIFAEGAFSSAFVPAYAAALERDGKEKADKMAHDAMATLVFLTVGLTLLCELTMPWLMFVFKHGFFADPEKFKWTVILTQITMPYLPCMAIVAHLAGVLNTRGKFMLSAGAPILLNAVTLLFIIPTHSPFQSALWGSIGTLVAGVLQASLLLWGARKTGAHVSLSIIPVFSKQINALLLLAVPGALAAAATQVNVFVSQFFSSNVNGATMWLTIADRFYQLPLGLVGVAIGTALLPALSRAVHAGDHDHAQRTMDQAVVYAFVFALPAAVALVAMPFFLVDGVYTRGGFHVLDSLWTARCLYYYGWGVPAFVLTRILNPAFFARKDTFGPMKFAVVSVVVNIVVGVSMFHLIGVPGLAIGTSAAAWVNALLMIFTLARRGTWTIGKGALARVLLVLAASVGMAVFCMAATHFRPFIQDAIGGFLPVHKGVHDLTILGHKAIGTKEIAIVLVSLCGGLVYIGLLFMTGAVRPAELKAMLKRR
ncbi:murein biosynthesis integral membrane protein MurJ [Asticcacaulis sp. EMRT-3]|uniref:murein biosynthesis integral membrane protein MurJ n=1 Tax=Asticcacaulis sp. EMRT-3 TaxID=3040349 RepID=UPI0024AF683E|nr:murein biosynthesis integral membrane protein MurJ [Asticcacaulis sp. EMRT-3]MDI7775842.1 murein biosynthesis integral membrane protein MurJ [Asticcacaulis sp. EMRT-3]